MNFSVLLFAFMSLKFTSICVKSANLDVTTEILACSEQGLSCNSGDEKKSKDFAIKNILVAQNNFKFQFRSPYLVENCLRKLRFVVHLKNHGKVFGNEELIVVDNVMDPLSGTSTPLISPVVMKIRRKQSQITYPLKYLQVVNGGVFEETIPVGEMKDCDSSLCAPQQLSKEEPSPAGFCCSCRRGFRESRSIGSSSHSSWKIHEHMTHININDKEPDELSHFLFETDKKLVKGDNFSQFHKKDRLNGHHVKKRESLSSRISRERLLNAVKKGRSVSKEIRHSCSANESATAHCLKFSDLWYTAFEIGEPYIIEEIAVKLFQKRDSVHDSCYWTDLTRGNETRLGTQFPAALDAWPTISLSHTSTLKFIGCEEGHCPIDFESNYLLIPSFIQGSSTFNEHPEAKGGTEEYLVVSKDNVSLDGTGCDKVGVSFDGFLRQEDRCQRPTGACLKNQPVDLWTHDMESRAAGKKGKYFLSEFGAIANAPLKSPVVKGNAITMEYTEPFSSWIVVEVRADSNALIRSGWNMRIQSVTCDSTRQEGTLLELVVVNSGIAPGDFTPSLTDCSDGGNIQLSAGPAVFIAPLHRHVFKISLEDPLPTASIVCTVEVHNAMGLLAASRQVTMKKGALCVCGFHCSCVCGAEGEEAEMRCSALMQEVYAAAGYRGGLPRSAGIPPEVPLYASPFTVLLSTLVLLLLCGKIKVALGCCFISVAKFGLDFIREGIAICFMPFLNKNDADELLHRWGAAMVMNMFFFLLYPTILLCKICCLCHMSSCMKNKNHPPHKESVTPVNDGESSIGSTLRTYEGEDDDERYVLGYLQARRSLS